MTTETERQVWADALADLFASPPGPSPTLLSVGAQPGAGKTRAIASTRRMFYPDHDFVEILGDDLRQYHPDYERLVADPDPEAMPAATADLSGWLVGQALDVSERIDSLRALARRLHAPVQVTVGLDHVRALTGTGARPLPGPRRWSSGQERAPGSATGHPGSARPPKPA